MSVIIDCLFHLSSEKFLTQPELSSPWLPVPPQSDPTGWHRRGTLCHQDGPCNDSRPTAKYTESFQNCWLWHLSEISEFLIIPVHSDPQFLPCEDIWQFQSAQTSFASTPFASHASQWECVSGSFPNLHRRSPPRNGRVILACHWKGRCKLCNGWKTWPRHCWKLKCHNNKLSKPHTGKSNIGM